MVLMGRFSIVFVFSSIIVSPYIGFLTLLPKVSKTGCQNTVLDGCLFEENGRKRPKTAVFVHPYLTLKSQFLDF